MKLYIKILLMLLISFSCKNLPLIEPIPETEQSVRALKGKYRLTHSIKAELPNGDNFLAIGVTVVDGTAKTMDAVIMTVEGLVMLDVSYENDNIRINRGVPPFDSPRFARGIIDDMKLIFFVPDCENISNGRSEGKFIKRYKCRGEDIIDIILNGDGTEDINKYDDSNSLKRSVNISSINKEGIPGKIELKAHGFFGYSLYMELISSERI